MAQEVTVTCDACGKPIENGDDHVAANVFQVDRGAGVISQARLNDYHAEHLPKEIAETLSFEFGDIEIIPPPGPGPEPETPGE
jgi:hypothetical protein